MTRKLAFALNLAVSGCASSPPRDVQGVQMNDLSVLLPLPSSQQDLSAMVAASTFAQGGALLPAAVYAAVGNSQAFGGQATYDQLAVVAFRLDPCFGHVGPITDASTCDNQLRLVLQPFSVSDGTPTIASDIAVHAFYALTRDQLIAAVNALVAARVAEVDDLDLGPLAPNVVVAREGLSGALAQSFTHIITTYAGGANLVRVTGFVGVDEIETPPGTEVEQSWVMGGFEIASGTATALTIPSLPDGATTMSLGVDVSPLATGFTPTTTSPDNIATLANLDEWQAASSAQRQTAFDAALRIENPLDNSPNTIDCASCHMALPARELVGATSGMEAKGDPNAFVPDAGIPATELAQTTDVVQSGHLDIHAFSYLGAAPMINQRTINETAANLAYLAPLLQL
jgi:hypothetical protein